MKLSNISCSITVYDFDLADNTMEPSIAGFVVIFECREGVAVIIF